jgi:serine/threonine-protein phosphatase 2A regulatory subunit B''
VPLAHHPAGFPCSKMKLDNLFLQWLAAPDTQKLVLRLVDDAKAGRALTVPGAGGNVHAAAAASPPAVGPLAAVGGAASSPLSPSAAVATAAASAMLFQASAGGANQQQPPLSPRKAGGGALGPRGSPPSPARAAAAAAAAAAAPAAPSFGATPMESQQQAATAPPPPAPPASTAIPPFYAPATRAAPPPELAARAAALDALCASHPGGLTVPAFKGLVRDVFELPSVLAYPLFARLVAAGEAAVPCDAVRAWVAGRAVATAAEPAARLFDALRRDGAPAVTQDDLKAMMAGVLLSHPGLEFLQETPEFQDR